MAPTLHPSSDRWSDGLPFDLVGQFIALLPHPADRARFRAVCRSWQSAVREHVAPPEQQLPWIVRADGSFVTLPDRRLHRLPLPDNTSSIGATGGWLAIDRTVGAEHKRAYFLHSPFFGTTLTLPGMDSVVKPSRWFKVCKVLMRSSNPDDVVAVQTNNWNYPVILCRAGKPDVWIPKPQEMPYARIIDIAFLGDNLYGITSYEGLVVLELGEDDDGTPTVVDTRHIIGHPPADEADNEELDDNVDDVEPEYNGALGAEEDDNELLDNGDDDVEPEYDDDAMGGEEGDDNMELDDEEGDDKAEEESDNQMETDDETSSGDNGCDMVPQNEDLIFTKEPKGYISNYWHLVESNGKLLMVKREKRILTKGMPFNTKVEVLEADMDAGSWVPAAAGGRCDSHALFFSNRFSKSVPLAGENFTCYFAEEHDDVRTPGPAHEYIHAKPTWVFPHKLVV
ncbi:hypothetical protein ACQ4PT_046421 [Festuca glaucescens]